MPAAPRIVVQTIHENVIVATIMKLFTIACLDKLLEFVPTEAEALSILGVAV